MMRKEAIRVITRAAEAGRFFDLYVEYVEYVERGNHSYENFRKRLRERFEPALVEFLGEPFDFRSGVDKEGDTSGVMTAVWTDWNKRLIGGSK